MIKSIKHNANIIKKCKANISSSDSKYLLSVMCYWNKVRMVCCQVMKSAMNTRTNEIYSDSSERKYVHLSNGLVQSFEIRYTFTV